MPPHSHLNTLLAFDLIHSRSHPPPNQCCIFGMRVFRNCRQRDNRTR
jgi:hypothetical protein